MAQEAFKVVDTIAATSLKFIQSALPAFTGSGLKLDGYRITILKWNGHYTVLFDDPNTPRGCRGSCSREKPSFEVELSEDGTVVGGNFVR